MRRRVLYLCTCFAFATAFVFACLCVCTCLCLYFCRWPVCPCGSPAINNTLLRCPLHPPLSSAPSHALCGSLLWRCRAPLHSLRRSSLRVGSSTRHERRVVRLLRRGGSARHLDLSTLGLGGWPEPSSGMPYPPRACRRIRTLESAAPRPPCGGPWSPPPPRSLWLRTYLCLLT